MSYPYFRNAIPIWDKSAECIHCGQLTYMLYSGVRLPDAPFDEINIVVRGSGGKERGRFTVLPHYSEETYEAYGCKSCGFWMLKNPS